METGLSLVVLSGLSGVGKTTIARLLAVQLGATFLRIDVIEQSTRAAGVLEIGHTGYAVANALAESNLLLGRPVVADCVNPVRASRLGWQAVATRTAARLVNLHLVCTDVIEHRRRVENCLSDIGGHILPTWEQINRHEFEEWEGDHARIDTGAVKPTVLVDLCADYISGKCLGI